jgi:hypothetical protein
LGEWIFGFCLDGFVNLWKRFSEESLSANNASQGEFIAEKFINYRTREEDRFTTGDVHRKCFTEKNISETVHHKEFTRNY